MKKKIFFLFFGIVLFAAADAQRYAIVDTKYILDKLPDYRDAQKQLDQTSVQWQKEIDDKQSALDKMYKDYEAEQVMLSEDLKKKERMKSLTKRRKFANFSANDLVLKEICSKEDRNSSNLYRTRFTTQFRKSQLTDYMTLF